MPISREVQERKGDLTEAADESVVGIEMVQAFGREDDVRDRFGAKAESIRGVVIRQAGVEARHLPGLYFLPGLSIAVVLLLGGEDVINGDLTIGQFVLFNSVLLQLAWPLESLGWILNLAQRAVASAGRSFAWLEQVPRPPAAEHPRPLPEGPLGVRYDDVRFGYETTSEVLAGVDFVADAGELVAVCGATGSGKSTLLSLLSRFYDPTQGAILIGGCDVRDVELSELRGAVAVVTQRAVLFSVSLRDNLMAGRPDASWDAVLAASEAAGVASFVDDLPDGYETLIGERGVNLSGRPAPARGAGPRTPHRRSGGRAGRPAVGGRHPHRARPLGAAATGPRHPHGDHRDSAAVDGAAGRSRGRARRRQGG